MGERMFCQFNPVTETLRVAEELANKMKYMGDVGNK